MEENNNFLYSGYLLVINHHRGYWSAECKELEFYAMNSSISFLRELFKKFVDEKLDKEKEMTEQELFNYHGYLYLLTIKPISIEHDLCGFIGVASYGDTILRRFVGDTPKEIKEKLVSYINENPMNHIIVDGKDKKIAKLVEVIDSLNKKLEEKDKKIERLKKDNEIFQKKIAAVKFEINKAE